MERSAARRGLIVLGIASVLVVGLIGTLRQVFKIDRRNAMRTMCLNELKCAGVGFSMYASDWDERLPPLRTTAQRAPKNQSWPEVLELRAERTERHVLCFTVHPGIKHYSYNRRVAGIRWADIESTGKMILAFDTINNSAANNNLNGGSICHPDKDHLPVIGSYVVWPKKGYWYYRDWPKWSKPIHGDTTVHIVCCDGHAKAVEGWDDQFTLSPKQGESHD